MWRVELVSLLMVRSGMWINRRRTATAPPMGRLIRSLIVVKTEMLRGEGLVPPTMSMQEESFPINVRIFFSYPPLLFEQ